MVARVVQMRREHLVAGVRQVLRPAALGTERAAFDDRRAAAVVRAAIEILDRLHLRLREARVGIDVVGAHRCGQVALRLEVAHERLVDDAVLDAVVCVATRQHGVGEDLELAQALRRAVAVGVEREIAGIAVAEHALQQPRMACVQLLIHEHGRAGDDAVEVAREALRFDEPFAAARRAALEIRVRRGPLVISRDDSLARVRREVHGTVAEIDLGLAVVEREPRPRLRGRVVAHVAVRDRIALREAVVGIVEVAVLRAVAVLQESAVPALGQRQLHVIGDAGRKRAAHVAMARRIAVRRDDLCSRDRQIRQVAQRLARCSIRVRRDHGVGACGLRRTARGE